MLKFVSPKPKNTDLGKYIGKSEGTIRGIIKKDEKEYSKLVHEFKYENYPFVKLEEYKSYLKENGEYDKSEFKEFKNKIKENKLPHTNYTDGLGQTYTYIPTVNERLLQIKEIISDLKIEQPITFSVGNHKGGATKTTDTTNIAATLAYFGFKVLIVDFDHQGNASGSFGLYADNYKNTIIDLIVNSTDENIENLVKTSVMNIDVSSKFEDGISGRLDVIPNNATKSELVEDLPTMSRTLGTIENSLDNVLSYVKNDYDFIFIDLPPRTDIILRTAMMASDYFLIALSPQPFAKMGMPYILNPIEKFKPIYKKEKGKEFKILGGIVGYYEKGVSVQDVNYEQIKNDILDCTNGETALFETYVPKNTMIQEAQQGDGALIFSSPCDRAVKNFFELTLEILERAVFDISESRGE